MRELNPRSKNKEPKFTPSEFVAALHGIRGLQHFDAGGAVGNNTAIAPSTAPSVVNPNQNPNPAGGAAASPVFNPSNYILPAASNGINSFAAPLDATNQSIFNHAGGIAQGFAGAFTAQNGFNANLAPTQQTNYGDVIGSAATNSQLGNGQFNSNLQNEQNLAAQFAAEGRGQGPNPAQNALNQATGTNVANTAALMAGQRGAGSNVGLIARQAANAGAGIQQQSAGQAATLQAQQALNAQQNQAGLYGQVGNQITGEQGANNTLFSAAANAQNSQNTGDINNYSMAQGINSQVAQNNANATNKTMGGLLGGASSVLSLLAKGGMVKGYDNGGMIQVPSFVTTPDSSGDSSMDGPMSFAGKFLNSGSSSSGGGGGIGSALGGQAGAAGFMSKGGAVPAMVSPGEEYLSPDKAKAVAAGKANPLSGRKIPGKAKVKGDSYQNDTVPAKLKTGGVVIPRHIMESKDPANDAAKFVATVLARQGMRRKAA